MADAIEIEISDSEESASLYEAQFRDITNAPSTTARRLLQKASQRERDPERQLQLALDLYFAGDGYVNEDVARPRVPPRATAYPDNAVAPLLGTFSSQPAAPGSGRWNPSVPIFGNGPVPNYQGVSDEVLRSAPGFHSGVPPVVGRKRGRESPPREEGGRDEDDGTCDGSQERLKGEETADEASPPREDEGGLGRGALPELDVDPDFRVGNPPAATAAAPQQVHPQQQVPRPSRESGNGRTSTSVFLMQPSGSGKRTPLAQGCGNLDTRGVVAVARATMEDLVEYQTMLTNGIDFPRHSTVEDNCKLHMDDSIVFRLEPITFPCLSPAIFALSSPTSIFPLSIGNLGSLLSQCCPHCDKGQEVADASIAPTSRISSLDGYLEAYFVGVGLGPGVGKAIDLLQRSSEGITCDPIHRTWCQLIRATQYSVACPFQLEVDQLTLLPGDVPQLHCRLMMKRSYRPWDASKQGQRIIQLNMLAGLPFVGFDVRDYWDQSLFMPRAEADALDWTLTGGAAHEPEGRLPDPPIVKVLDHARVKVPENLADLPEVPIPEGLAATPKPHQVQNLGLMLKREREGVKEYVRFVVCGIPSRMNRKDVRGSVENFVVFWNPLTNQYTAVPEKQLERDPSLEDLLNPTIRGGILADEMGLGKTLSTTLLIKANPQQVDHLSQVAAPAPGRALPAQRVQDIVPLSCGATFRFDKMKDTRTKALPPAVARVQAEVHSFEKERIKATLVVVPVSLFGQWVEELKKMLAQNDLAILPFHGSNRDRYSADDFRKADVVLTTYETLRASVPELDTQLLRFFRRSWASRSDIIAAMKKPFSANDPLQREIKKAATQTTMYAGANPASLKKAVMDFMEAIPDTIMGSFHFHRVVWDECQKVTDGTPFVAASHHWLVSGTPADKRERFSVLAAYLGITAYCTSLNKLRGNCSLNPFVPAREPNWVSLGYPQDTAPNVSKTLAMLQFVVLSRLPVSLRHSPSTRTLIRLLINCDTRITALPTPSHQESLQAAMSEPYSADIKAVYDRSFSDLARQNPLKLYQLPHVNLGGDVHMRESEEEEAEDEWEEEAEDYYDHDDDEESDTENSPRYRGPLNQPASKFYWYPNSHSYIYFCRRHMIRHLKAESESFIALPLRTEVLHSYSLTAAERKAYDHLIQTMKRQYQRMKQDGQFSRQRSGALMGWVTSLRQCVILPTMAKEAKFRVRDDLVDDKERDAKHQINKLAPPAVLKRIQGLEAKGSRLPENAMQAIRAVCGDPPEFPDCIVCFDQMLSPLMLPCHHLICRECLFAIHANQPDPRCPYCRGSLRGPKVQITTQPAVGAVVDTSDWNKLIEELGNASKMTTLLCVLQDIWNTDATQKVVVFSSYTEALARVAKVLKDVDIDSVTIDGGTTLARRSKIIADFQNPASSVRVCLITSRCGNAGLTLTAANHLILLEPHTSEQVEQQAAARIHRFGQLRPVFIHRLVATGTIEEIIRRKATLGNDNSESVNAELGRLLDA